MSASTYKKPSPTFYSISFSTA